MNKPKKHGGARKGTGPKGPHGREIKKTYSFGMYPSDVAQIKTRYGPSLQSWINKKVAEEGLEPRERSKTIK